MTFPLLTRRRELAVAIETTKGTAAPAIALDGTDSKYLVINPTFACEFGVYERDFARQTFSRIAHQVVNKPVRMQFSLEVRRDTSNKGTTTPDNWGKLLQGCGFQETVNTADVSYTPVSALNGSPEQKTLTMHMFLDGMRVGMRGAMGNVEFVGEVGSIILMNFDFQGVFIEAVDDTLNTITHEDGVPPPFQGVSFTYNAETDIVIRGLSLNMNNEVQPREDANDAQAIKHFAITNRNPEIVIDPEMGLIADEDFLNQFSDGDEMALTWNVKTSTPDVSFSAPKAQIKAHADQERNGFAVAGLTMGLNGSTVTAEDDEISITME